MHYEFNLVNGPLMAQRSPGMTCVSRVETDFGRRSKTRPHLQLGSWSSGSVQAGPTPVIGRPWTPPHGCLEGTATPALCRPARTHVASERNHRNSRSMGDLY